MSNKPYELITLWTAHGDGGERGIGPVIGYSLSESSAERMALGRGWYGGNGDVKPADGIKLPNGDIFVLKYNEPVDLDGTRAKAREAVRKAALAKLSPEEKKELGL